jgi:ABC-2 type transport system permease protein
MGLMSQSILLKEILVAPISRVSVFVGKMLGGSTDGVIQGSFVFVFSFLVSIRVSIDVFLFSLPIMLLITFGMLGIGLTLASLMGSLDSDLRQSFLVLFERRLVSASEFPQMVKLGKRRRSTNLWC